MNKRQLRNLGVPEACLREAMKAISAGVEHKAFEGIKVEEQIRQVVDNPQAYQGHAAFGDLASALMTEASEPPAVRDEPAPYHQWGNDLDENSIDQMKHACSLPISVAGALMPDAHLGYGLPIGGVLATENHVIPYGVGVDIACRMKLSITDLPVAELEENPDQIARALRSGTCFGVGGKHKRRQQHDVMDRDWNVTPFLADLKDKAWSQLGTSGSGNHFVEWGILELPTADLGLEPGKYLALLSHSGSRGAGAQTCSHYSELAANQLPARYREHSKLAWLDLDTEIGQEYWTAMNLMGDYASANHAVIHRNVLQLAGAEAIAGVENHHNFAWKEVHNGRELVVHRKGATPAGAGVLGVIPGSMADSCFVVRGKGEPNSLASAAHGAGRVMSRTQAKKSYQWGPWRDFVKQRGVRLLGAGLDEVPGVYKNIHEVMNAQRDLVDIVASFQPKVVLMCDDGSRAED